MLSENQIAGVTLAVLALMSVNMLITRIKLEEIALVRRDSLTPISLDVDPESFDQDWRRTGDLMLYGTSLLSTILSYQQWIAERLSSGHNVRILLMKPGSEAVVLASERCYLRTNHHDDAALRSVLDLLERLNNETNGHLELRFTRQEPTFTAVYFEPNTPRAVLYVMYYRYRMNSDDQMRLVLRPSNNRWFGLHADQVEHLWRDSELLDQPLATLIQLAAAETAPAPSSTNSP